MKITFWWILTRKCGNITPFLASLHCLPLHVISDFKVLMTYKSVKGFAKSYLSDLIKPYVLPGELEYRTPVCSWELKRSQLTTEPSLSCPFPANKLPADIRQSECIETFKSKLLTNVYGLSLSDIFYDYFSPHTFEHYIFLGQPQSMCLASENTNCNFLINTAHFSYSPVLASCVHLSPLLSSSPPLLNSSLLEH